MYKLVVSDFDGTLIDQEGRIPLSTVILLDELRRKGIKIGIVTGRCLKSVLDYNKDFVICDYLITSNGAYIYDLEQQKVLFKKAIGIRTVKKLIKDYYEKAIIYLTDHNTWNLISEKGDDFEEIDVVKIPDRKSFLEENKKNIYKMELHFKTLSLAKKSLKEINNLNLKINANLQLYDDKFIVEITNFGVSKKEGLKKILTKDNLSMKDVIAFGCGYNDLELLKEVGLAVVVKNAIKEAKNIADDQTLDHNSKGVESYLKKVFY